MRYYVTHVRDSLRNEVIYVKEGWTANGEMTMKNNWSKYQHQAILVSLGVVGVVSCSILPETPTPFMEATETMLSATQFPSPIPTSYLQEGETLVADSLALTVFEHKLEGCYISNYGNEQCPSPGAVLLWVRVQRENIGHSSDLPIYSCFWFEVLYGGAELKTSYFHDNHSERENWNSGGCGQLFAGYADEGWVSFEVPEGIVLSETLLRIESYEGPELERLWKLGD